jgi:hypothetical protein
MHATITCTACGTVLGVPKGGMPKDGLSCNWCGYVNLPTPEPEPKAAAAAAIPSAAPTVATQAPATTKSAPYQWGDDEDDNGDPYDVTADAIKLVACPGCGKQIAAAAVICVHCGYDATAKQKVERTYQPIDREWQTGWPLSRRLAVFIGFQAMNVITTIMALSVGGSLPGSILGMLFAVAIQAWVLGTFDTLRIRRNRKGQAEITITWRYGFVPQPAKKINWREHEGVAFGHYDAGSVFDWIIALLLLPYCIVPAVLWWYYIIRSDRFFAALCRDRGYPETYLYRGMKEQQAKEIAQIATDATALPLTTPL